ncbi:hypothetical protein O6H91_12G077400 [Diphasiastrum complanatum]|uniref:Uncharacterized protein n=1 Tax=Diphasiastrum complanatum TaxID=34168 RepID=A0ACC2C3W1_DIPCM|nr:hypothetical protein O6H91_12G077400 [Diphasiastrum complanatum]
MRQAMEAEWQGQGQQQQQLLLRERPYERGRGNDPAEGSSSMVDAHMVASAAGGEKSMSISAMVEQREGDLAAIAVLHRSRVENGVGQSEAAVSMDDAGAVQRSIVDEGLCGLGLSRNGVRGEFGAIVSQPDDLAEEMSSLASQRPALHHDFSDMASQQVEDGYGSMAKQQGLVEDEAGAIAAHRAKEARVYRKGFWSMNETMVLLSLKRQDNEKQARGNERERNRTSAERWREIEEGCWARGVKKSSQQIKDKWDHLSADFKKVMDYENSVPVGQKSYWQMTTDERREIKNMPLHFHLQVYQYMNQWMRKSKPIRRTVAKLIL